MTEQAKLEQKSKNPSVDKYKNYKLPDNSLNPAIAKIHLILQKIQPKPLMQ